MELHSLGWNDHFNQHFKARGNDGWLAARVAQEHRHLYTVLGESGELSAKVSGRFQHEALSRADFPAVGDWVLIDAPAVDGHAVIHAVLPRRSSFSRKAVLAGGPKYGEGRTEEQVLAANIDTAFLVSGLDHDLSRRRIERFLSVTWDSGASPVIILNKTDVCDDVAARVQEVLEIALGVPVHPISAEMVTGLEALREYLTVGRTAAFLGSSGVGKSTIINRLLGEDRLDTGGVRLDDSRGRHTTTRRELILLPQGGLVIDTPGLRRIQLWGDESGLSQTFGDIEQLITRCRFADCQHQNEPGCAVRMALAAGDLEQDRYASYLRLQKEFHSLAVRKNVRQHRQEIRARDRRYRQFHKIRKQLRKKGLM